MRYIDKDALADAIRSDKGGNHSNEWFLATLENAPEINVRKVELVDFREKFVGQFIRECYCDCGGKFQELVMKPFSFCPYCGGRRV